MPNQPTERGLLEAHGAGKGDVERSTKWRAAYDQIDFHRDQPSEFMKTGEGRSIKRYSAPQPVKPEEPLSRDLDAFHRAISNGISNS